jgi:hypothetical protein
MTSPKWSLWVVAVSLGLALAACGGSGQASSSGTTARSTTSTGSSTSIPAQGTGASSTTTAPFDPAIAVYFNCSAASVEPTEIVLSCPGYSDVLLGIKWNSWSASSAVGVGILVYNDCVPSCTNGQQHNVPGTTVTLTRPEQSRGGQLVWSEVQENPEPPGYDTGPYHGGPQPLPT